MTLLRYDDLFIKFNNLVDDRLCLVLAVEEQRIVGAPLDRPAVQPGVVVADAPQGDAANLRAVLIIDFDRIHRIMQETEIIKENRCEYNNNNLELWRNRKEDKKRGAVYSTAPRFIVASLFILQ